MAGQVKPHTSTLHTSLALLTQQHGALRLYQWLWIAASMLVALAVFAPRILSRPLVYQSTAQVQFDTSRYGGLYVQETPGPDFTIALNDARETLRQRALAQRELRFGRPDYQVVYHPLEPGHVRVIGIAPTATEAQTLATSGADELVRHVRAAGGREVLRNLLGWELVGAMRGEPLAHPFEPHLRAIIEHNAFPMSRPIEPVSAQMHLDDLTAEEQNDLTRALEARYDLWSFEINTRNATLDTLCTTSHIAATAPREAALQACAATAPDTATHEQIQRELDARNRAITSRRAINDALHHMLTAQQMRFQPSTGSVARTKAPLPPAPEPRHTAPLLLLTLLGGFAFGVASVAIDRTAGVMPRMRELASYHELIGSLVLRDLRARYKGSMLGYLWTQLAPLLMMLVFTFVFTFLMRNSIALFPVFLIVALLPWNFFNEAIASGTRSVLDNANLIKKVFFPREILPLVSVLSSLLNYLLSLPMMFLVMGATQLVLLGHLNFAWTVLYLPVVVLLQTLLLLGLTFFLSALAVFVRDIVHLIGIVLLFWFFLTPVFYSLDTLGTSNVARVVRWLNPMATLIEFYREILYGNTVLVGQIPTPALPAADSLLRVLVTVLLVLVLGYWFFQRCSGTFGEEL